MQVLAYCLPEAGNHAENTDRAGKGCVVGEDLAAASRNEVSAGGSISTITGNDRLHLAQEFDFAAYHVGGYHFTTGRVYTENHSLDAGICTYFGNRAGKRFTHNVSTGTDDLSIGI